MIFIFGGAYQGKLEYARKNFDTGAVCDCTDGREPDLACGTICGIAGYVARCVREGEDPVTFFHENEALLRDKILINTDVSCGVVPADPGQRAFREANGRVNRALAGMADRVVRVFCGLGKEMTRSDNVI